MIEPNRLNFVSYLAPNLFWFYQSIAAFWERSLSIHVTITPRQADPLHDSLLLEDQLDGAFICGLPFARYRNIVSDQLQAIAAPVMQASRYQNKAVYFSDVIVSSSSNFKTFNQLVNARFCYNDPGSNSGYNLLRHYLMHAQYPATCFNQVLQSGSHQQSIRWIVDGKADCAAIDSTVLEQELRHSPKLAQQLRVVESIGPSPMPPIVVSQRLGDAWINQLQTALLQPDAELRSQMDHAGVLRFEPVQSVDYAELAQMHDRAVQLRYEITGQNMVVP